MWLGLHCNGHISAVLLFNLVWKFAVVYFASILNRGTEVSLFIHWVFLQFVKSSGIMQHCVGLTFFYSSGNSIIWNGSIKWQTYICIVFVLMDLLMFFKLCSCESRIHLTYYRAKEQSVSYSKLQNYWHPSERWGKGYFKKYFIKKTCN